MSGVSFDARVIEEFADRLYKQAASIVIAYTIVGVVLGAIVAAAVSLSASISEGSSRSPSGIAVLLGAAVVGSVGYAMGKSKAFQLRLQAQTALCQLQIEKNTRK